MKNGINFANPNHKMKKSIVIIIIAMLMGCFKPLSAQIIYTEEDAGLNPRAQAQGDFNVMVPMQGVSVDQWKSLLSATDFCCSPAWAAPTCSVNAKSRKKLISEKRLYRYRPCGVTGSLLLWIRASNADLRRSTARRRMD